MTPLISVLIPLEFHRDQALKAIRKWRTEQTLEASRFELILVASRTASSDEMPAIRSLLGPQDRLVFSDSTHDMGQVAEAARWARSELLFFTESHVWPTPTVLDQCLALFAAKPEWAAISCRTHPITPNRLAKVEARMYEADIVEGMTNHPWRKILDQCFVTRRDAYERCGGFEADYGHFAEVVLAARYAMAGLVVGYAPEIELSHRYIGQLEALREFTDDFAQGEMLYWSRAPEGGAPDLMDPPIEWWQCGNRDRALASQLVSIACRSLLMPGPSLLQLARSALRHAPVAVAGGAIQRARGVLSCAVSRLRLSWAQLLGSEARLEAALRSFIQDAVRLGRLREVRASSGSRTAQLLWRATPNHASQGCGLHGAEVVDGVAFRWAEPVGTVRLDIPPGRRRLVVETLLERLNSGARRTTFFFNGRRIPRASVRLHDSVYVLDIQNDQPGPAVLGWVTRRLPAPGDKRLLGLPVVRIALDEAQAPRD